MAFFQSPMKPSISRAHRYMLLVLFCLSVSFVSMSRVLRNDMEVSSFGQHSSECFGVVTVLIVFAVATAPGILQEDWRKKRNALVRSMLWPLCACTGFMLVGPALMILNKSLMQEYNFPYPLTLSGLGLLASTICARVAVLSGLASVRPDTQSVVSGFRYWQIVVPIGGMRALTLATGNAVYLHLSLGFIQMLKAFTPAIVLVVMFVAKVQMPARPASWCVLLIVLGTMVDVKGELHATAIGLLFMMASSIGEAVCTVMSQKLLQNFKFSEIEALYFLSLPSTIFLTIPALFFEWPEMLESGRHLIFFEHPFLMLSAALLGICVNLLTFCVIRATSSVILKILNVVRCIGIVAFGSVVYGESHSSQQLIGYGISLLGFLGFNFFQVRHEEAAAVEAWVDKGLHRLSDGFRCLSEGRPEQGGGLSAKNQQDDGL